jgi:hypothetical protein
VNAATTAGVISTLIFVGSNLPMVVRAARTRDLTSYSRGYLVLVNAGNAVYTLYVVSLPAGPIWLLHLVYTAVSAFMLLAHIIWVPVAAGRLSRADIQLLLTGDEDVVASWEPV